MGIVCLDKSDPSSTLWAMPAHERLANPIGIIQGGFLAALADSAMGATSVAWAKAQSNTPLTSANVEMKISFLAPVRCGEGLQVLCLAKVVKGGRRAVFLEAELTVEGTLVAKASSTYLVTRRSQP